MIVVRLMGGLGNQMFQYAAGLSLAHKHKTKLRIDRSWFDLHRENVDAPRDYELDCFTLPQDFISPDQYIEMTEQTSLKRRVFLATKAAAKPKLRLYTEPHYHFDSGFWRQKDNVIISGFWQSEQYFGTAAPNIQKAFSFAKAPSGKNKQLAQQIAALGANSVSLHVRRSDYANIKTTKETHGLMGLDYYREAIKLIEKKIQNPTFFVISDDPEWCKKHIKIKKHETIYIDHNKDGWKDMQLMSLCQNHIIANSSFSWWGAWLDQSQKKIVIGPKRWFADTTINVSDVLPKGWKKL
ncbi:MAG: alpha-1,2-fucosyltransferase [Candidatus Saccharibacteria bacterium]|nr:alpha-1,2-fucosyltransferase [Candidatus Saccharibacteria bacterium]